MSNSSGVNVLQLCSNELRPGQRLHRCDTFCIHHLKSSASRSPKPDYQTIRPHRSYTARCSWERPAYALGKHNYDVTCVHRDKMDISLQFNNFLVKNTVSKQNDYNYTLRNRSSTGCFCSDATQEPFSVNNSIKIFGNTCLYISATP